MGRPAYGVKGITLRKNDYVVGLAVTPNEEYRKARQKELKAEGKDITPCLIVSVSENGFGKRTDAEDRLQTRGGSGVINIKANTKIGKFSSIPLVDEPTELMVISSSERSSASTPSPSVQAAPPQESNSSTSTPTTRWPQP